MSDLPDDIVARLHGDGVTPKYVAEKLGIGTDEASRRLTAVGGKRDGFNRFRIPSRERNNKAWKRLAKPSEVLNGLNHHDGVNAARKIASKGQQYE